MSKTNRKQSVVVDGKQSNLIDVVSGVPGGTVLVPLLVLLHINDLPLVVSSKVRLFADDGFTWGMRFNAAKCNVMQVSRTRDPKLFNYSLTGQVLEASLLRRIGVLEENTTWNLDILAIQLASIWTVVFS